MVIFVTCVHNYYAFEGFRLDSHMYTAHPDEKEILLCEGAPVAVIGSEEVRFDRHAFSDPFMKYFNGKKIIIIYLFHSSVL